MIPFFILLFKAKQNLYSKSSIKILTTIIVKFYTIRFFLHKTQQKMDLIKNSLMKYCFF